MICDQSARSDAIDPSRSFCVSAPAGSGKTELLTQRLLALLARVDRPEQVLAITFTRKAASEKTHRVLEKLEQARNDAPVAADHDKVTRRLALAVIEHAERRGWHLDEDTLNLRTIDSFCHELTRQMPILSGLGGVAEPVDNPQALYEEAVRSFLSAVDDGGSSEGIRQLLRAFDNRWQKVSELLVALLGRRGDWGAVVGQHHNPTAAETTIAATLDDLISHRLAHLRQLLGHHLERLAPILNDAQQALDRPTLNLLVKADDLADWRVLASCLLTAQYDWRKPGGINKRLGFVPGSAAKIEFIEILGTISGDEGLREALEELFNLPDRRVDKTAWNLVVVISSLLPMLQAHLLWFFQRSGAVDHTHIALAAIQALGPDDMPTGLAQRLDYQIEHLLVDEFQDTSASQAELLRCLTRGWSEHNATGAAPRTLFVVGDAMQSIYGFRYADVSLFLRARQGALVDMALTSLTLTQNFRSEPAVVSWVNETFSALFGQRDNASVGRVSHVRAESHRTANTTSGSGVGIKIFQESGDDREARFIASEVAKIRAKDPQATVAVLVRAKSHAPGVALALATHGIACGGDAIQSLPTNATIADLMTLCRWLANPADSVAALALMRSPWCGLDLAAISTLLSTSEARPLNLLRALEYPGSHLDDEEQLRIDHLVSALRWAETKRDRLALSVWVEQIWLQLAGAHSAKREDLQYVESFFAILRRAEESGRGLDISWLEQEITRSPSMSEDDPHAVRIMTLHKAKGLEFDYVFVPYLHKRTRAPQRDLIRWHWHEEATVRGLLIAANDDDKVSNSLYNYLNWLQKIKDKEELKRLLYVGITRARTCAFLSASVPWEEGEALPDSPAGTPLNLLLTATHGASTVEFVPLISSDDNADSSGTSRGSAEGHLIRLSAAAIMAHQASLSGSFYSAPDSAAPSTLTHESSRVERIVGIITHRVLELLATQPEGPQINELITQSWIANNVRLHGLTPSQASEVQARCQGLIKKALGCSTAQWILSSRTDAYSEMALNRIEDGECKTYVIDRTFLDDNSGIRWVIDFKTSEPQRGASLSDFIAREAQDYRGQLITYAELIAAIGWADQAPIKAGLYYPAIQHLSVYE